MSDQTIRLSPSDHTAAAVALIVAANDALNRLSGDEAPVMATIGQTFQAAQAQAMLAVAGHLGTLVAELTEMRLANEQLLAQLAWPRQA